MYPIYRYNKELVYSLLNRGLFPGKKYRINRDIITFDTEAYTIDADTVITYLWTACINGTVIYGRTPEECKDFFDTIRTCPDKFFVWVHNLAYDFPYLDDVLGGVEVLLAPKPHKVIIAKFDNIEFRCTYALSNSKLEVVAKMYNTQTQKTHDLDHSKPRHYDTPLTDKELEYATNDAKIVEEYISIISGMIGRFDKIPWTFTGLTRLDYRRRIWERVGGYPRLTRDNYITNNIKTAEDYDNIRLAYKGPYLYVNDNLVNYTFKARNGEKVVMADIGSDYPYQMFVNNFPLSIKRYNGTTKELSILLRQANKEGRPWLARFYFEYIKLKDDGIPTISEKWITTKRESKHNVFINNKVMYCKNLYITLTGQDFMNLDDNYEFKTLAIKDLYIGNGNPLPIDLLSIIREDYALKSILAQGAEKELTKARINSLSGMCGYDVTRSNAQYVEDSWEYDEDLKYDLEIVQKILDSHNKKPTPVANYLDDKFPYLLYQWAPFITAYARRDLCKLNKIVGADHIISNDTDCQVAVFYSDEEYEEYKRILSERDKQVDANISQMCKRINKKHRTEWDIEDFTPIDYDSTLGHMPIKHEFYMFKILKSKCYLYCELVNINGEDYHYIEPVVSGGDKQAILTKLIENIKPMKSAVKDDVTYYQYTEDDLDLIFDRFSPFLKLSAEESNNRLCTYPSAKTIEITDYLNNTITAQTTKGTAITYVTYRLCAKAVPGVHILPAHGTGDRVN